MMEERFKEPRGFEWGHFTNNKGAKIRYGHVAPEGEMRGTVILLTGLNESIEKYFELTRELRARGMDVWLMDWRGQGRSERYFKSNPQKAHSEGYQEQIDSLHQFTQTIVKKSDKPMFMVAQSMGAHIGLRYLKEHEGVFDSAMLTSPMIDVHTGVYSRPVAEYAVDVAKACGYLDSYVPGLGEDWNISQYHFEGNNKTSDRARFQAYVDRCHNEPDLRLGTPTYGWYYHTFESAKILNDEKYLKSIQTPVLMHLPENETVVDRTAQQTAAKLLPNCKKVDIQGAQHSLWIERNEFRDPWLNNISEFMDERLKIAAPIQIRTPQRRKPPAFT